MSDILLAIDKNIQHIGFEAAITDGFKNATKFERQIDDLFIEILASDLTINEHEFRFMIESNANPLSKNKNAIYDGSPLLTCIANERINLAILLINEYDAKLDDNHATYLSVENIKKLVTHGFKLSKKMITWNMGKIELVDYLLEIGISLTEIIMAIDCPYDHGYNSLFYLLEKLMANPCYVPKEKLTELLYHIYDEKDNYDVKYTLTIDHIDFLFKQGINIHYENDYFFVSSFIWDDIHIINYLLSYYDINTRKSRILKYAIRSKNIPIIKYLLDVGIHISDSVIKEAVLHNKEIINLLANYGASPEKMAEIFVKMIYLKNNKTNIGVSHYFVKNGIDLGSILNQCLLSIDDIDNCKNNNQQ